MNQNNFSNNNFIDNSYSMTEQPLPNNISFTHDASYLQPTENNVNHISNQSPTFNYEQEPEPMPFNEHAIPNMVMQSYPTTTTYEPLNTYHNFNNVNNEQNLIQYPQNHIQNVNNFSRPYCYQMSIPGFEIIIRASNNNILDNQNQLQNHIYSNPSLDQFQQFQQNQIQDSPDWNFNEYELKYANDNYNNKQMNISIGNVASF
ncbi:hypothetical protein C1645_774641 [Glomus cerebriforme]|uniref:Uncharacterized protein n=1 Tax=Glomus cerebriforme TaxID=658196 RepID=A0A397SXP1_9GLOM|nr:hypothetical protein C1645_774641 [Glomus cerebriforme]